jgi:hypothetical protein
LDDRKKIAQADALPDVSNKKLRLRVGFPSVPLPTDCFRAAISLQDFIGFSLLSELVPLVEELAAYSTDKSNAGRGLNRTYMAYTFLPASGGGLAVCGARLGSDDLRDGNANREIVHHKPA